MGARRTAGGGRSHSRTPAPTTPSSARISAIWARSTGTQWPQPTSAPPDVKEGKQAEFLVQQSFPWALVERIGVIRSGRTAGCAMRCAARLTGQRSKSSGTGTTGGWATAMIDFQTGDILAGRRGGAGQHGELRRGHGPRDRAAIQEGFPRELQGLRSGACERDEVQPGRMFVFETGTFATRSTSSTSRRSGTGEARAASRTSRPVSRRSLPRSDSDGIRSVAVPPLGSGLGGLDWSDVRPRIAAALGGLEGVEVFGLRTEWHGLRATSLHDRQAPSDDGGSRGAGRSGQAVSGRTHGPVRHAAGSAQADVLHAGGRGAASASIRAGARTGPYAENLRHVLREIEGHYLSGYGQGGEDPTRS